MVINILDITTNYNKVIVRKNHIFSKIKKYSYILLNVDIIIIFQKTAINKSIAKIMLTNNDFTNNCTSFYNFLLIQIKDFYLI